MPTTHEDLIGYALDLLEPAERRAMERHLAANPSAALWVERMRGTLAPLAADRDLPVPPTGLAIRTVARLAERLVAEGPRSAWEPAADPQAPSQAAPTLPDGLSPVVPSELVAARLPADRPDARAYGGWLRADVFVTAGIGALVAGLVLAGIGRSRFEQGVTACQNNLRAVHQGLVAYSDTHEGRFPQVGDPAHPTAGSFTAALADGGNSPSRGGYTWHCPGSAQPDPVLAEAERTGWNDSVPGRVQYTYALGYRGPDGGLLGPRRTGHSDEENDNLPIVADYPAEGVAPGPGPVSPHVRGHNVLYVGGHVRHATTATVGVGGDDIFRNQEGKVAAGLNPNDAALGRPADRP